MSATPQEKFWRYYSLRSGRDRPNLIHKWLTIIVLIRRYQPVSVFDLNKLTDESFHARNVIKNMVRMDMVEIVGVSRQRTSSNQGVDANLYAFKINDYALYEYIAQLQKDES